jgi:biotin carboxyl carrier protein
MLYTVQLNRKKYVIDVEEKFAKIVNESGEIGQSESENYDLVNELPDFDFCEEINSSLIFSQMQGKIISINVSEGQNIKKNQVLAVLESMKMQMNILAKCDGIIQDVKVCNGDLVKLKQELFEIKFLE